MSTESTLLPPAEMDSAWKQILDAYFQEFMTFFYPVLADAVGGCLNPRKNGEELKRVFDGSERV